MIVARRYVIGGRVQGIGFRYFVYDAAGRESVRGWVRNLFDGRVEACAEGEADAVDRFERRIRVGTSLARVDHFEVQEVAPTGAAEFDIRPTAP